MQSGKQLLRLYTPATYCIQLQGILDTSWSEHLGGMTICVSEAEGNAPKTILTGRLEDQAALSGVLNGVYNLGFPILSVEYLDAA